jgi:hypothetical protein
MLDQNFSTANLQRLVSYRDLVKYDLGKNKTEIQLNISKLSEEINKPEFLIDELNEKDTGNEIIFSAGALKDVFALKKLNDNIRRLYKVKQSNRHLIVKQLLVLLKETQPMTIIRLDVKRFYESIDRTQILKKLNEDSLLSYKSKIVLDNLFKSKQLGKIYGLPRGLNISASLSELYMRDFDEEIRQLNGVYYYARYVDDIIIFCHCDSNKIIAAAENALSDKNLKLNNKKTKIVERACKCKRNCKCVTTKTLSFEYLGYRFEFSDIPAISIELKVSLGQGKIKKIKSRIIAAFISFFENNDFELLDQRIALLTGNYVIKTSALGNLKAGIHYNYPFIDKDSNCLKELNTFLRKAITAKKGAFGLKMSLSLNKTQKRRLVKYCFASGHFHRRMSDFKMNEIKEIRKCWTYV